MDRIVDKWFKDFTSRALTDEERKQFVDEVEKAGLDLIDVVNEIGRRAGFPTGSDK